MPDSPDQPKDSKPPSTLGRRWASFAEVVFDPLVVLLLVATAGLIYLSVDISSTDISSTEPQQAAPSTSFLTLVSVVIAVLSSVIGAVIHHRLAEQSDSSKLVTRGKSAIRGLKILLLNLGLLENRTKVFLRRSSGEEDEEVRKVNLEEVIERLNSMQEEALNAIEEWQDIIPEANVKTQIGIVSSLKEEQAALAVQIESLQSELDEAKDETSTTRGEASELKQRLRTKEAELSQVQKKLRDKERELDSSVLSGLYPHSSSITLNRTQSLLAVDSKMCSNCFNQYDPPPLVKGKCPHCGEDPSLLTLSGKRG